MRNRTFIYSGSEKLPVFATMQLISGDGHSLCSADQWISNVILWVTRCCTHVDFLYPRSPLKFSKNPTVSANGCHVHIKTRAMEPNASLKPVPRNFSGETPRDARLAGFCAEGTYFHRRNGVTLECYRGSPRPGSNEVMHVKLRKRKSAGFELFSSFMFLCD